ncbi:50S ribosomal protein L9 [Candidatus Dependentiae bacterium]|nr:50S ribosomal protein L9 [Candidatus Dependentiae bacterium]MCC7414596.1 50S ribosomal protein L9 [Campylobacterota bacterium]
MSKQVRVFLLKDVEKVGCAGEIVKVADGFAHNFLIARKLGLEVTEKNEKSFEKRIRVVEQRNEVIATQTSLRAERIKSIKLTLKRKTHDDGKLYGSVSSGEVVDLLAEKGESVGKSQIEFDGGKLIKATGTYEVTVKLSSKLQPKIKLSVVAE